MWICDKCSEKQPDSVSYCMSCKRNEKLERTRYLHNLMSSDLERIPEKKVEYVRKKSKKEKKKEREEKKTREIENIEITKKNRQKNKDDLTFNLDFVTQNTICLSEGKLFSGDSCEYYPNGKIKCIETYSKGQFVSKKNWDENGKEIK